MATKLANEAEGSSQVKKNLDNWKFRKIPVNQVYKQNLFRIFPSYAVNDYEETITLNANEQNVSINLFTRDFIKGFIKKQHKFLHLGLVQIAIKPLLRDGLGAPIVVALRDARLLNFKNSLLAFVESNLSQGPFYFDCFPSYSVSLDDPSSMKVLTLYVMTSGIPLALTYRLVCKATVDLSSGALKEPVLGETTYIQPSTGTRITTKWNELQVPESWVLKEEPVKNDDGSNE